MRSDDEHEVDPTQPLSIEDALLLATRLHRAGGLDEAERIYDAVLRAAPDHADALQFKAIAAHQRGRPEEALVLMQLSLAQQPNAPGIHLNLGNILLELQRYDEAATAYDRCSECGGESPQLFSNLGILRHRQGHFAAAELAYRRAIALAPKFVEAYTGYGHLLILLGRPKEAMEQFCRALVYDPAHAGARHKLALAYHGLGRHDDAARVYREWLEAEPGNAAAMHYLAANTGQNVPERASDAYVQQTFDRFANSFDSKLERLNYRAPDLIADAVAAHLGTPSRSLDVLDAGCGTGLCGARVGPYARRLVGVDLSPAMLEKAKERGYHDLHHAELTSFIASQPVGSFDLIIAADTLCYFGDLDQVFGACRRALRGTGLLVFSVEVHDPAAASQADSNYRLHIHGRYSHTSDYVRSALNHHDFAVIDMTDHALRTESAAPVPGLIVVARAAADSK